MTPVVRGRHDHLRRRHRLGIGLTVIVVTALLVALATWLLDDPPARRPADGTAVSTAGSTPAPSPGTTPAAVPGSSLAPTGRSDVSVDRQGDVEVRAEVTWASPLTPLLSVPVRPGTGFEPVVTILVLESDGRPMSAEHTLKPGRAADPGVFASSTRVDYVARGTFVETTPSVPGRGLVLLTPVRLEGVRTQVLVRDERILNLACRSATATRVCGARTGSSWEVDDLAPDEDVVAQVDIGGGTG